METPEEFILVKLDISNAFNSVRRDFLLESCYALAPSAYRLVHLSYSQPSLLLFGNSVIVSSTGVQQGDPLGPLLFAICVNSIAHSVLSPINIWYLDDATICGPPCSVLEDLRVIIPALSSIGLEINFAKSEVINLNIPHGIFVETMAVLEDILKGVRITDKKNLLILGSPIGREALSQTLIDKAAVLSCIIQRLSLIDAHVGFFLLRNYFSTPKLLYTLRSSPCFHEQNLLSVIENILKSGAESLCNVRFDPLGWIQSTLPVSRGGIGLRSPVSIALPAFLSSTASSRVLTDIVLRNLPERKMSVDHVAALDLWDSLYNKRPSDPCIQAQWDAISCEALDVHLRKNFDQHRLACLRAGCCTGSGAWLDALPVPSTGNLLDKDCLRIGLSLRLGLEICEIHKCRCGAVIDRFGLHPLSCRRSAGRAPRHAALNDVIQRGLTAAGIPSILEPVGLARGDGKRPDGLSTFPFEFAKHYFQLQFLYPLVRKKAINGDIFIEE
ncbi:uncharacterized protein LOC115231671 [Octopus sinensis]|uniref:Uncharacterized protein LOC115231671 n=1 Tax=Octopus sinensis TaxID=2607531 RepID=A0A6P7U0H4_9MOLL|nr:uncharacterized protein LOC115231671 [Octopus sinensis]